MAKLNQNLTADLVSNDEKIIANWFQFFKEFKSGCTFAALVAHKPEKFGWHATVIEPKAEQIAISLNEAINHPRINTISLIFPSVRTVDELKALIEEIQKIDSIWLEFSEQCAQTACLGFRLKVKTNHSWITGFGDFDFLPKTRQAPYTSLTLRVKPKPVYQWVMKASNSEELHLADMDVKIVSKAIFEKLWNASFTRVKNLLGGSPDLRSAAKTTFAIPI